MPTAPQPITLRPLASTDLPELAEGQTVYLSVNHAGERFYEAGFVKSIKRTEVTPKGLVYYGSGGATVTEANPVIGEHAEIIARNDRGGEVTIFVDSSAEVFDTLYPVDNKYDTRSSMLSRAAKRDVAVPGNGGDMDFPAQLAPRYGSEVSVRILIPDADPATIADAVADALTAAFPHARFARTKARDVLDLRVNVSEMRMNDDGQTYPILRAVNLLTADIGEYMTDSYVQTTDVPYGTPPVLVVDN